MSEAPANLSAALADFEAELTQLAAPPPAASGPTGAPAKGVPVRQPPQMRMSTSVLSGGPAPSRSATMATVAEPPRTHTYSTAYETDMKNKYNEAQAKAQQFRTEAQQAASGYGRAPRVGSVTRKAAGDVWEDPTLIEWPESRHAHYHPIRPLANYWRFR